MLFAELCSPASGLTQTQVIAFGRVWWKRESTGEWIYPFHGSWTGVEATRLGRAMLRYNEDRLRHIAQDHAPGPKWYQVWATEGQAGAHALFLGPPITGCGT